MNANLRLRLISMTGFVIVWQVAALLGDTEILPAPLSVLLSLYEHLLSGELIFHLTHTLRRVVLAFVIAMLLGAVIGFFMGRRDRVNAVLDGLLILALNLPALVTIILCYIWFGLNETAAVTAVAANKIPNVAVTIREGTRAIDRRLLAVADVYKITRTKTLTQVILPQLYPYLVASARTGLALIWKIVLVVELLGRSNGVGFQLGMFFNFFDITSILAYTLAFALIIFVLEALIMQPIDRKISLWR